MGTKAKQRRQIVGSLREISLFAECTDRELLRIDGLLSEMKVEAGSVLAGRGAAGLQFLIVCDGYGRVASDGDEIGRVGPGSHIGERTFHGSSWKATVTAITPMRLLILNAGELAALLREAPSVRARIEQAPAVQPTGESVLRPGYAHA